MAGDWIKMRGNLWDDPKVAGICDATGQPEAMIVGALYWLWATADQHTEDGILPGLTLRAIDRKTGVQGFGAALVAIGWLIESTDGVCIAHFEDHNGASAKKRCQTAKRVASFKAGNAHSVTDALAERDLEKRREEIEEDTHTALPRDWKLSKALGDWAIAEYPHWTAETVRSIADQFRDHHTAKGSTSAEWGASWRKWCRDDLTQSTHKAPSERKAGAAPSATVPSAAAEQTQAYLREQEQTTADPEKRRAALALARSAIKGIAA